MNGGGGGGGEVSAMMDPCAAVSGICTRRHFGQKMALSSMGAPQWMQAGTTRKDLAKHLAIAGRMTWSPVRPSEAHSNHEA